MKKTLYLCLGISEPSLVNAARYGDTDVVKFLLENGDDVNVEDNAGQLHDILTHQCRAPLLWADRAENFREAL